MTTSLKRVVIRDARHFLAHVLGLVRYGSKPWREIPKYGGLVEEIASHLRSYEEAASYLPNRVFLGGMYSGVEQLSAPLVRGER